MHFHTLYDTLSYTLQYSFIRFHTLPHPFLCGHWDNHFRTRRTKYIPDVNFRQKPTTLKFYRVGGGGGSGFYHFPNVHASGMTKKMNRTMYLLFLLFLERLGHLATVASVCTSKCSPAGSISAYFYTHNYEIFVLFPHNDIEIICS